jgi:hypothetical protein
MLAWLHPIALVGVLAALGPIAVHLLRRHRANRLPFASVRFVRAASTAAVRLRLPSDIALLLIRVAIVAGAAVALAQPIFVGQARRSLWDGRLSRAIVVDVSESMKSVSQRAFEAANAEGTRVHHVVRVEAERPADGLARAVEALTTAPPSRREIVVVSDFQDGSITPADIEAVPQQIGLRFVNVGDLLAAIEFRGDVSSSAPGVRARVQQVQATREGTGIRLTPIEATTAGLQLIDAGPAGDGLLRAVARAGAPAPSVEQPIALAFLATSENPDGSENARDLTERTTIPAWMLRTVVLMRRDPVLSDGAREHSARGDASRISGLVVARDAQGAPVVVARADGTRLLLTVAATPLDYVSATTLRSALIARRGEPAWQEHETLPIPAARLAGWARDPAPIGTPGWQELSNGAPGDARWVWLVVLLLLVVETVVRRRRRDREGAAYADAA